MYSYFFQGDYAGLAFLFGQLLHGNIYIQWLGATWFVIVLFGIYLLWETIGIVYSKSNINIDMVVSWLLAVLGIVMTAYGTGSMTFRLVLVTQFLFMLGRFCAEKNIVSIFEKSGVAIVSVLCNVAIFCYFAKHGYSMDIASGRWPNSVVALVMILNGCIFLHLLSKTIADHTEKIKKRIPLYWKEHIGNSGISFCRI